MSKKVSNQIASMASCFKNPQEAGDLLRGEYNRDNKILCSEIGLGLKKDFVVKILQTFDQEKKVKGQSFRMSNQTLIEMLGLEAVRQEEVA